MKVDIGGGNNPKEGFKCMDIIPEADYQINLEKDRFPFENDSIDEYHSQHTFEHIDNIIHIMNEVYRTLKPNGIITIKVPHKDCELAWQDPTHKRFWVMESFKYFCGKYILKYKLNYGITCCFLPVDIKITAPDSRPDYFKEIRAVLKKSPERTERIGWNKFLENNNVTVPKEFSELRSKQWNRIAKDMKELFMKKNGAYGDDFFTGSYTDLEIWMSIKRKVSRLDNHYKNESDITLGDENLEDTWKDLANYCVMMLMKMRGEKSDK